MSKWASPKCFEWATPLPKLAKFSLSIAIWVWILHYASDTIHLVVLLITWYIIFILYFLITKDLEMYSEAWEKRREESGRGFWNLEVKLNMKDLKWKWRKFTIIYLNFESSHSPSHPCLCWHLFAIFNLAFFFFLHLLLLL